MMDKKCTACAKIKTIGEFKRRARNKSGYDSVCKDCSNFNQRHWRANSPEKAAAYRVKYKHPDPTERSRILRIRRLARYGLTPEMHDAMLREQGGVCYTCKKPEIANRALAVDHDHSCCPGKSSCGKCVRALLCTKCNQGIGQANERIEILESWIAYLRLYGK